MYIYIRFVKVFAFVFIKDSGFVIWFLVRLLKQYCVDPI